MFAPEMDPTMGKGIFINLIVFLIFFFFLESLYGDEHPPGICARCLVTGFAGLPWLGPREVAGEMLNSFGGEGFLQPPASWERGAVP